MNPIVQGLVTVPFWVYWTSPYSSHGIDHIPNGWVMFNGSKPWYLVNPKIAGKWMFIPLKMVLIGIDPYPFHHGMNPIVFIRALQDLAFHKVQEEERLQQERRCPSLRSIPRFYERKATTGFQRTRGRPRGRWGRGGGEGGMGMGMGMGKWGWGLETAGNGRIVQNWWDFTINTSDFAWNIHGHVPYFLFLTVCELKAMAPWLSRLL